MNPSIINIDYCPTEKYCHICDQTMKRDSTRNHCKSISHNINLLIDGFSESFDIISAIIFIKNYPQFCKLDEVYKTLFARKKIAKD